LFGLSTEPKTSSGEKGNQVGGIRYDGTERCNIKMTEYERRRREAGDLAQMGKKGDLNVKLFR